MNVVSFNDYLRSHPKLPGGVTHDWVKLREDAYVRKIWYAQSYGDYNFPYVFWNDLKTVFYYQYQRVFATMGVAPTLDEYMANVDRDYLRVRKFESSIGDDTGGTYDRELRKLCVLRNDPLVFDENSKIFQNITMIGEALDAVNEKITAVEKLTREQLIANAREKNSLDNIERTHALKTKVDAAVKQSGSSFDKDARA